MKAKALVFAALSVLTVSAVADTQSNSGFYAGGGVNRVELKDSDAGWTAVELLGGYKLNPYVGGELRLGAAAEGDPNLVGYSSLYYRTESANPTAKAYLLAGVSSGIISVKNAAPDEDDTHSFFGASFGAGVGFVINSDWNLNLEYRLLAKDTDKDLELTSIAATIDYRF
ncbi:MAG TPA: porin family protein [Cellvibrio sp.]|nr:porin family protein [Cellvibrio sp.]